MSANKVEISTISPSSKVAILEAIATIRRELKKTVPTTFISENERDQAAAVSNTCMPYIDRTFNKYIYQCSQIIPRHKNPEEALQQYAHLKDLKEISVSMRQLMEFVDDLDVLYKNDVYYYFLRFYIMVRENLEQPGVNIVYNDLSRLFEGLDEGDVQETKKVLSMF
ncbi:MAG: hypothetical protein K1X82_05895 [Bacteroidia bacterium]|nr:hypothetical protein [Bacteroidia bacterium]